MPTAEILAIGSAAIIAFSSILVRVGLNKSPSQFTAAVTFFSATIFIWLIVAATHQQIPTGTALYFFSLRGLIDPGLAALLIFAAFRQLGVAITVPIIAASPLVSTALSAALLGEKITIAIVIGTIMIVTGVAVLTFKRKESSVNKKYLLMAIAGSVLIGLGTVVTKHALNIQNLPVGGLAISFAAALIVHAAAILILRKWKELPSRMSTMAPFLAAGIITAIAFLMSYAAFSMGDISVIFPLLSTQPIFALMLSYVLLRQQEKINLNVILGTLTIVAGAVVLTAL